MENTPGKEKWHVEKNISLGHIFTTIAAIGSVVVWGLKMDNRVTVLEAEQSFNKQTYQRLEEQNKEARIEIRDALIRIEMKIDRKADK